MRDIYYSISHLRFNYNTTFTNNINLDCYRSYDIANNQSFGYMKTVLGNNIKCKMINNRWIHDKPQTIYTRCSNSYILNFNIIKTIPINLFRRRKI